MVLAKVCAKLGDLWKSPPLVCGNNGLRRTRIASCGTLPKKVHYRMFFDLISYEEKATPHSGPVRAIRIC